MTLSFSGPSIKAGSGKTESLVVLLHGYGASGDDLISLGHQWAKALPDTDFIAPNAPFVCEQNPEGYQWCSLIDWDMRRIGQDLSIVAKDLHRFIDRELELRGLDHANLALVGFSLGVFMALEVGLNRPTCAGIIGYSGGYIPDASRLIIGRPDVLLIHGDADVVLEPDSSRAAYQNLKVLGIDSELHILPGIEHYIDVQGLGIGAGFLKQHLCENSQNKAQMEG